MVKNNIGENSEQRPALAHSPKFHKLHLRRTLRAVQREIQAAALLALGIM